MTYDQRTKGSKGTGHVEILEILERLERNIPFLRKGIRRPELVGEPT